MLQKVHTLMENMMSGGMMGGWPMAIIGVLVLILLILAIAALAKYLFGSSTQK